MTIQAVVFDIGGVLEITPRSLADVSAAWESRLGLASGELNERMADAWHGGGIGTLSEQEVHRALTERLGLDEQQLAEFLADLWREYLGTANTELIDYARRLRPRYRTGILSNSFVGAREREQAAYGFEDLVDEIVYSHECGMSKPDPAIYALACERLGVAPAQMVFLDDLEPYVEGARWAGIHAVLYRDNAQAIGDIERLLARDLSRGLAAPRIRGVAEAGELEEQGVFVAAAREAQRMVARLLEIAGARDVRELTTLDEAVRASRRPASADDAAPAGQRPRPQAAHTALVVTGDPRDLP